MGDEVDGVEHDMGGTATEGVLESIHDLPAVIDRDAFVRERSVGSMSREGGLVVAAQQSLLFQSAGCAGGDSMEQALELGLGRCGDAVEPGRFVIERVGTVEKEYVEWTARLSTLNQSLAWQRTWLASGLRSSSGVLYSRSAIVSCSLSVSGHTHVFF